MLALRVCFCWISLFSLCTLKQLLSSCYLQKWRRTLFMGELKTSEAWRWAPASSVWCSLELGRRARLSEVVCRGSVSKGLLKKECLKWGDERELLHWLWKQKSLSPLGASDICLRGILHFCRELLPSLSLEPPPQEEITQRVKKIHVMVRMYGVSVFLESLIKLF